MAAEIDPWLRQVLERVDDLPALPEVAQEVVRLCGRDEVTVESLAEALALDPGLSARLLRLSNSSAYGLGHEVRTLPRACAVLGLRTVQLMTLCFSLPAALPRAGPGADFDHARYWRRSLVRGTAARALARRLGSAPDEAFLAGLLGEVGRVVLARCARERYAPVLAAAEVEGWPSAELEQARLGFDHRAVGAALLSSWELPRVLALAVRHGADADGLPAETDPELQRLARVLDLAACATDVLTLPDGSRALVRAHERAARWFTLENCELFALLEALDEPLRAAAELLELELPIAPTSAETLAGVRASS